MVITPLILHREKINFGIPSLNSSLFHGLYTGDLILDNGEKINVVDMLCHAEDIYWRW